MDKHGSDPFYKDIFLEVDWIKSKDGGVTNKPPDDLIEDVSSIFKNHKINLHVDTGNLGGGEEISFVDKLTPVNIRDIYWSHFLDNDLDNPRKGIFRYALIMEDIEMFYGGFVFVGWDHLDTIGFAAQRLSEGDMDISRGRLIVGSITHELGHILGLFIDDHGGIDNDESYEVLRRSYWKYRNYKSCMNYLYVWDILGYSDGTHGRGDFDDWGNFQLDFFKNTKWDWPN
jgi:hypothetical protein